MRTAKKSLAFQFVGDTIMVLRENKLTPTDQDWDDFLEALAKNRDNFDKLRILVMTDGGGPSTLQRKRLEVALGGRPVRVAVVSASVKVRFIVSSIALLNRMIATFSPDELSDAYSHLSMSAPEQRLTASALRAMEEFVEFTYPSTTR